MQLRILPSPTFTTILVRVMNWISYLLGNGDSLSSFNLSTVESPAPNATIWSQSWRTVTITSSFLVANFSTIATPGAPLPPDFSSVGESSIVGNLTVTNSAM